MRRQSNELRREEGSSAMTALSSHHPSGSSGTWSPVGDTVRMPWSSEGVLPDTVVRPALAVLFRMAVGPAADYYVPRFLRREGNPGTAPGWVWPAFFFPTGWAFYRKRWLAGAGFLLLHFFGLAAFLAVEPVIGRSDPAWWLTLAAAVLWVPGALAATMAVPVLHAAVRRSVRNAEAVGDRPDRVAAMLAGQNPTSVVNALLLGFAAVALWLAVALPQLEARYDDRVVRGRVAATLVAVAPLQMAVDDSRRRHVDLPAPADAAALVPTSPGATWLESVTLGLGNGRLRLVFADALAPLAGKTLLLAPAVDDEQQLQWVCVPVDIPRRLLPRECRVR